MQLSSRTDLGWSRRSLWSLAEEDAPARVCRSVAQKPDSAYHDQKAESEPARGGRLLALRSLLEVFLVPSG
jgi:hypothetical protein